MSTDTAARPPACGQSRRGLRRRTRPVWVTLVLLAAAAALVPVVAVAAGGITPTLPVWRTLAATTLPGMLVDTLALLVTVGLGTAVLGAGLAWLVTAYRFPGSRAFSWLLILPLAMPAYILGFVLLSLLDVPGPIQIGLRALLGPDARLPELRTLPGAAVVLSLALYPYVYALARTALTEQAPATLEAARVLGASSGRAAWRVVLPLARPSLAAGLALVMMETLTDFATVTYFNVQTVSVGVYQVWKGQFDRAAATELASLVLVFALLVVAAERRLRGRARYHQQGTARGMAATRLRGARAAAATLACGAVLAAAFVIPIGQLLWWFGGELAGGATAVADPRYLIYLANSLGTAAVAAGACVVVALVVTHGVRLTGGRLTRLAGQLTTVGYALPGVVVAIGVLIAFAELDTALERLGVPGGTGLLVTGSVVGIVYAYVVRFLALGYHSVDASLRKVSPAMTASALTLGAPPVRVLTRVHLPLARSGVGAALLLVLVDALKELPIVLLLRPFGFTTVSVWTWQLASESRWESAGLPALTIVAAALVPVLLLRGNLLPVGEPRSVDGR